MALTGQLELHVASRFPAPQAAAIRTRVEAFFSAIELGLFGDAHSSNLRELTQGDGPLIWNVALQDVPKEALRVLHGMLEHARIEGLPIDSSYAHLVGDPYLGDLLQSNAAWPSAPASLPFQVDIQISDKVAPPIVIVVSFARDVSEQLADEIELGLGVWSSLLQGGYPPPGYPAGTSVIAAPWLRLDSPTEARATSEGFHAHLASFHALQYLALRWHRANPIVGLEVQ